MMAENETSISVDWAELEHQTVIALKDTLEDELVHDPGRLSGVTRGLKTLGGIFGRKVMSSGQYEENDHYLKYGLLDLIYNLSFRVTNCKACFEEMIGAIQAVLERSHKSAEFLHRKAIDLFHKINEVGRTNNTVYGKVEEREVIIQWMAQHPTEVETEENSRL